MARPVGRRAAAQPAPRALPVLRSRLGQRATQQRGTDVRTPPGCGGRGPPRQARGERAQAWQAAGDDRQGGHTGGQQQEDRAHAGRPRRPARDRRGARPSRRRREAVPPARPLAPAVQLFSAGEMWRCAVASSGRRCDPRPRQAASGNTAALFINRGSGESLVGGTTPVLCHL